MVAFAFWVFLAGLISFLSPCVLPLVPGYVSMLSGIGVDQLQAGEGSRARLLSSAFAFVTGFSAIFIIFGASASAIGSFLLKNKALLAPIAGALIVLFGLHLMGWLSKISIRVGLAVGVVLVAIGVALNFRSAEILHAKPVHFYAVALIFLLGPALTTWLNRDVRLRDVGGKQPGVVSGFLLGFAFALGWTPCIGPILTSVLAIAATRQKIIEGVILLTCYSAGLAIPFLLTALGIGRFLKFYQRFRRHFHTVEVFSGVLLLAIGALIFTNGLTRISGKLARYSPENLLVFIRGSVPGDTVLATSTSHNSEPALPSEPAVVFKDLQGNHVPLSSLKGKVVLVNFWATWCDPCRVEIPWLIDFQQKYASEGFTMLGVAMDDEGADVVSPFVQKTQFDVNGRQMTMNYPIVIGDDDIATAFGGLLGYPTSFLITRDGKIAKKYVGLVSEDDLEKELQALLKS
jgi:cytochrome c-type biogenesis protein